MSEILTRVILTGDTVEIVPLTDEELQVRNKSIAESAAFKTAAIAADAAKAIALAKLAALGLTTDDLKALGL